MSADNPTIEWCGRSGMHGPHESALALSGRCAGWRSTVPGGPDPASPVGSSVPGDTEKGDDPNDERAAIVWGIVSRLTPVESDAQEACEEIEALFAPLLAEMTRQRDAWRHDALSAEDRIDALNEKLRDREAVR